jgi:signal transduction histidine kinase
MRARLMLLVGATSSLVLVAFLVPLALLVRSAAADRAMSAAIVDAQELAPLVATAGEQSLDLTVTRENAARVHQLTVFLPDHRVIGAPADRSANVDLAATGRSITADAPGGREVLVAVSGLSNGTAVIRTFVPRAELTAGVARAWLVLGLLGLGLLGVSFVVANRLARSLVRPIKGAAESSYRIAHGQLDARAAVEGPVEIQQVSIGLNLLASRIGELLARERETAADLSHRVRTPLTALRIDAEALREPQDRARITADLDAVERTVSEVIREARRPVREELVPTCDAVEVVTDRMAFWSALAEEEGRSATLAAAPGPLPVGVTRQDLSACIDALLDNVFTHTPEGCGFAVELATLPTGAVRLSVADEGPGPPGPAALQRGHSGADSTGLGLDIVRRTALRSGGTVTVAGSASGGARIEVDLGPPARTEPMRHRLGRADAAQW